MSEKTETSEEFNQLMDKLGKDHCKIIHNVGDFTHIFTVKLEDLHVTVKFQITATYPESVPGVVVISEYLSEEAHADLLQKLALEGRELQGKPMLAHLVQQVKVNMENLVEKGDLKPLEQRKTRKNNKEAKAKMKRGHKKRGIQKEEHTGNEKLVSMKTAEDVISRIQWDDSLDSDDFVIGYLDRFLGVVEKGFSAFSWEDLSSVDWTTLAIPKHRIQYFKYRTVVVWDKNSRLDNMFGSTGSGKTIQDVIVEYREKKFADAEEPKSCVTMGPNWELASASGDDENGDDDDDDNVEINLGEQDYSDEEDLGASSMYKKDHYYGPKVRPTHFLCLRITDDQILHNVTQAHDILTEIEPAYTECIIPPERLHVTLCCLGLDTERSIQYATETLQKIKGDLMSMDPLGTVVSLNEVDNFFHNVLYAKVENNYKFMNFVNHLKVCLQQAGVEIRDLFEFTPHMTVLKLSSAWGKEHRTRFIDTRVYSSLEGTYFGQQCVDNIYLCKMSEEREDGFYVSPSHISF